MRDEHTTGDPEQNNGRKQNAAPKLRKNLQKNASRLFAAGLLVIFIVLTYLIVIASVIPKRYELAVGAAATENIAATREVEDKLTTEANERAAEYSVQPVQALDTETVQKYEDAAADYFDAIKTVRTEAERIKVQKEMLEEQEARAQRTNGLEENAAQELQAQDWRAILADADFSYLKSFLPMEFADIEVINILLAKEDEMLYLSDAVFVKIKMALRQGLDEASAIKAQTAILLELDAMSMSEDLKRIASKAVTRYVATTLVKDDAATLRRQQQAVEAVQPVIYYKGDLVVKRGDTITPAQIEVLEELGLVRSTEHDLTRYIGVGTALAVMVALFGSYVMLNRREVLDRPFLLGLLMIISLGLMFLGHQIDARLNFTFIGVMLISLLVNEHIAVAINLAFAFIYAMVAGGQELFSAFAFETLATTIAGGTVGIYLQRRAQRRATLMVSGVIAGLTAALIMIAMMLMIGSDVIRSLMGSLWVFGSYTICAVFCIGTLPLWESIFDIATASRLMELSNLNHPALKRLMTEAPGTYHHSLMVASLAEAGADAVGANGLLARVGAYYHDIGKLRRPIMFMENQRGENPHDKVTPAESANVILSHVRDGVAYAQKYKLPSAIQRIIFEHHGTTPVLYFYNKALQDAGNKAVNLKDYRYPGAKPRASESAIVMLADSVEAAVRSLSDRSRESTEGMIRKIIKGKLDDDQLSACPLTFADINTIENAFIASLSGMRHERIEYPNMPLLEDRNN